MRGDSYRAVQIALQAGEWYPVGAETQIVVAPVEDMEMLRTTLLLMLAILPLAAAVAGKPPAGGFRGVPWTGSRADFKRAIPALTCYPIDCRGTMYVGDIATELDVTWGGFAAHATSITLTFPVGRVPDMAKVLRTKYGAPSDQHREDGELVSRWRLPDVIVYLYHGSATDHDGVVYFEPTAQLKIQKDEFKAWKKQQAEKQKHSMRDASSAW